jgi:hypothetical protein
MFAFLSPSTQSILKKSEKSGFLNKLFIFLGSQFAKILFIDHGNKELVAADRLLGLPAEYIICKRHLAVFTW